MGSLKLSSKLTHTLSSEVIPLRATELCSYGCLSPWGESRHCLDSGAGTVTRFSWSATSAG